MKFLEVKITHPDNAIKSQISPEFDLSSNPKLT